MTGESQRSFFREHGYLVAEDILTEAEVSECEAEITRLYKLAEQFEQDGDSRLRNFQREPFAKDKQQEGLPVLRKIEQTGDVSEVFKNLAAHPRLVSVIQNLMGSDLLLFRSTLMLKPAFHGSAHAWHQDSAYWPMDPPALLTVSIALTDSNSENGCIQVVPGSHQSGMQDWGRIWRDKDETMTDREDFDTSTAVEAPLKAGSAVMFHSLTVHGSGPNNSPNPRHTALYAFFPPTVKLIARGREPTSRSFRVIAGLDGRDELTMAAEPTG